MDNSQVAIVIVLWNSAGELRNCLTSINNNIDLVCEVIGIDNDSQDNSLEIARGFVFSNLNVKRFEVIANKENRGFASACNQGIAVSRSRHVLLLNPDAELLNNVVSQIAQFVCKTKDAGVVSCKILNENGSIQSSVSMFPSIIGIISKRFFLSGFLKKHGLINSYSIGNEIQEVDSVKGAFFFIAENALKKVGVLDENIFLWFEETDYCARVKENGLKTYYFPYAEIKHIGGVSFKKVSVIKKQLIWNRSLRYYFKKRKGFAYSVICGILDAIGIVVGKIISFIKK